MQNFSIRAKADGIVLAELFICAGWDNSYTIVTSEAGIIAFQEPAHVCNDLIRTWCDAASALLRAMAEKGMDVILENAYQRAESIDISIPTC